MRPARAFSRCSKHPSIMLSIALSTEVVPRLFEGYLSSCCRLLAVFQNDICLQMGNSLRGSLCSLKVRLVASLSGSLLWSVIGGLFSTSKNLRPLPIGLSRQQTHAAHSVQLDSFPRRLAIEAQLTAQVPDFSHHGLCCMCIYLRPPAIVATGRGAGGDPLPTVWLTFRPADSFPPRRVQERLRPQVRFVPHPSCQPRSGPNPTAILAATCRRSMRRDGYADVLLSVTSTSPTSAVGPARLCSAGTCKILSSRRKLLAQWARSRID